MEQKMAVVSHFWIIHKSSGITIFSQQFDNQLTNSGMEDLIGGFLIAIIGFAKEIVNQNVELMRLSEVTLHYNIKDDFIMVALTSNSVDPGRIRILLDHVQDRFHKKYQDSIKSKFITNVAIYHDFSKITEEIFEVETQYITILRSRASSIEEFFQQTSKDWAFLHQKIIDQTKSFSNWGNINLIKINKVIQKDLLEARRNYISLQKSKDITQKKTGIWV
jgi:hypothetical protein